MNAVKSFLKIFGLFWITVMLNIYLIKSHILSLSLTIFLELHILYFFIYSFNKKLLSMNVFKINHLNSKVYNNLLNLFKRLYSYNPLKISNVV